MLIFINQLAAHLLIIMELSKEEYKRLVNWSGTDKKGRIKASKKDIDYIKGNTPKRTKNTSKVVKYTLPIYYQVTKKKRILMGLNWYRNAHYTQTNKAKKFIKRLIKEATTRHTHRFTGKVYISYAVYLGRRGSDGGNVRSIIEKFALDGFKAAGVITEDNFDVVGGDNSKYELDRANPRCEITITESKN